MAIEYPDLMNDLTDARVRYESDAVQHLAEFAPGKVPAGQMTPLLLTLQSVVDLPADVTIHLELPRVSGKLKNLPGPLFRIFQPDMRLTLDKGEVAQLTIPVHVQPQVPPGEYTFSLSVRSGDKKPRGRCRPDRSENRLGNIRIRHLQGLGITQFSSCGFESRKTDQQAVPLVVEQPGQELAEDMDLKPQFQSAWTPKDWETIPAARREVNDRRVYLMSDLTAEALYLPFMKETQSIFTQSDLQLHVAEAMFLAKILTYAVTYLMSHAEWQDCLMVPIYVQAQASGQATDQSVWVVTHLGYMRVLELAIALSFSLVEETLQRQVWQPAEQQALREFIVGCLGKGDHLPAEFAYVPLILGGIAAIREVVVGQEDIAESLRLLGGAKAERSQVFADVELRDVTDVFDRLVAKQARDRQRGRL
jgi:hypothetical protein